MRFYGVGQLAFPSIFLILDVRYIRKNMKSAWVFSCFEVRFSNVLEPGFLGWEEPERKARTFRGWEEPERKARTFWGWEEPEGKARTFRWMFFPQQGPLQGLRFLGLDPPAHQPTNLPTNPPTNLTPRGIVGEGN